MKILLLSSGGGGGNILRSVKGLFDRDVAVVEKTDPGYAARLREAHSARFLDTNEFSLSRIFRTRAAGHWRAHNGRLGARHDPDVRDQALEESKSEVERRINGYWVVIGIGTAGKGTGAGTIFPLAEMARRQRKLVLPIFVRPSFERHEVDKRRYDHALTIAQQFDTAKIRLVEILNDRGYDDGDPQPQAIVWERMNLPIARALRGLMYVLWDLSQVDPSDLSALFAGHGRIRIGFGELDPRDAEEPSGEQVERAVRDCWGNSYYAFTRPAGTSLICIRRLVEHRRREDQGRPGGVSHVGRSQPGSPRTRVAHSPKPWGVTDRCRIQRNTHHRCAMAARTRRRASRLSGSSALCRLRPPSRAIEDVPIGDIAAIDAPAARETKPSNPASRLCGTAVVVNRSDRALALRATTHTQRSWSTAPK